MNVHESDLFAVADTARERLSQSMTRALRTSADSPDFGRAQSEVARASAFSDAMLAAMRARFAGLREATK